MATSQLGAVGRYIRNMIGARELNGRTDGALLRAFVDQNDQFAFEAVLRRHGAMVMRVCTRNLMNVDDAEDAFKQRLARRRFDSKRFLAGYFTVYRVAIHSKRARPRRHESQLLSTWTSTERNCRTQERVDEEIVASESLLEFCHLCSGEQKLLRSGTPTWSEDSTVRKR